MFILDRKGDVIQQFPPTPPKEAVQLSPRLPNIITGGTHVIAFKPLRDNAPFLVAVQPIGNASDLMGYVLLMPKVDMLQDMFQFKFPTVFFIMFLLLSGWVIIYMMTRRLVKPI
jgi:flagellar basal body rod protein FlgC